MEATIVIPTFGRKEILLRTLDALERVDLPKEQWEVVIVDDGSRDGTEAAVRSWLADHRLQARFLQQENKGPGAARNRGAWAGRGRRLLFIDNDIVVEPDFLRRHIAALDAHPGCWILGRLVNPPELRQTPFGRYKDDWWESFHRAHPADVISETKGVTTQNLSMPMADFVRLNGFDEQFPTASCEDWDLAFRARQTGTRVLYDPSIVAVHHDWATDLLHHCERQRSYSMCDVLLWHKYGDASPRIELVRQNGYPAPGEPPRRRLKKAIKKMMATRPGMAVLFAACRLSERLTSDGPVTRRLYRLAEAVAVFRGVRDGLGRYGAIPPRA